MRVYRMLRLARIIARRAAQSEAKQQRAAQKAVKQAAPAKQAKGPRADRPATISGVARRALVVLDDRNAAAGQIVSALVALGWDRPAAVRAAVLLASRGAMADDVAAVRQALGDRDVKPP